MPNPNCPPEQEPYRALRVGDRIRMVRMPSEFAAPGYVLHPETRDEYLRLIASRRRLRVCEIDEYDLPWVSFRRRGEDGFWRWIYLLIDHDGWVPVQSPKG